MKIGITGSAGLIGSWIVEHLLSKGHKIISFDSLIGGYQDSFIQHENHEHYVVDITTIDLISWFSERLRGCEVVIHTAALAHEGLSVFSPAAIVNSVVAGTTTIASAAVRAGVKRFINCSSMSRYGDLVPPFYEWMRPSPIDPYGLAKVQAEEQLNLLGKIHKMDIIHAVPHMVIGPRQRYNDPFRNVVSIMTNRILQGKKPIIYGDGKQTRCFSFIQDDVEIYEKLINYNIKGNGEVFNIGPDDEEISIYEIAEIICQELNVPIDIEWHPERPYELKNPLCSSDKIKNIFNFQPKIKLIDGIKSVINYIKNRGPMDFEYHVELEINNKDNIPKTWSHKIM